MNLQHYLYLVLRHLWLLILVLALALGGAWAWISRQPTLYASRAVLEVQAEAAKVVKIEDVSQQRVNNLEALNTVVQSLTSNSVLLSAAKATGWEEWQGKFKDRVQAQPLENLIVEAVRKQVKVSLRRNTRLIDIVAYHESPEKAQLLAQSIANGYRDIQEADRNELSKGANAFLQEEVQKLKQNLEASERKLDEYRLEHKSVSLDEGENIVVERLNDLNKQVTEANGKRAAIEADLNALQQFKPGDVDGLMRLPSVAALPEVVELRQALREKENEFVELKERYRERHPTYIAMLAQLEELRGNFKTAVGRARETLQQHFATFKETESRLKALLAEQENKALELKRIAIPYNALQREVGANKSLYEAVLARLKETDVTSGLSVNPYRLIEEPLISNIPASPQKLKIMAIAGFLGLALGGGLILLLDQLDSSVRGVDEAEELFELPVLAAIPESSRVKSADSDLIISHDSGSAQAEGVRSLRASLSLLGEEAQRRIILITSSVPSEGKTFCSSNYAASLAQQGLKTLIIDADLRRPALSSRFIDKENRRGKEYTGLSDLISGLCEPKAAIRPTPQKNLWLMPAGSKAPNPAELLAQPKVGQLIEQLATHFDRIVIDSAPINAVSDTLSLVSCTHAVCVVVHSGKTPRRAIRRALQLLDKAGARLAGLVMNRMPTKRGAGYYYYYYGDPYVKDSVYGGSKES